MKSQRYGLFEKPPVREFEGKKDVALASVDCVLGYAIEWPRQGDFKLCHSGLENFIPNSEQGGPRGYDGAKNLCGRKRHLLVDTLGLVLLVVVTEANVQDRDGARTLLSVLATEFQQLRLTDL